MGPLQIRHGTAARVEGPWRLRPRPCSPAVVTPHPRSSPGQPSLWSSALPSTSASLSITWSDMWSIPATWLTSSCQQRSSGTRTWLKGCRRPCCSSSRMMTASVPLGPRTWSGSMTSFCRWPRRTGKACPVRGLDTKWHGKRVVIARSCWWLGERQLFLFSYWFSHPWNWYPDMLMCFVVV